MITQIEIEIPDYNDSVVSAVLCGEQYLLRFSWNDTAEFWYFGIYTNEEKPIVQGIKLIPNYPVNIQYTDERLPQGIFSAETKKERITRDAFINKKASFIFTPFED